ncbi:MULTISPECIES: hypothetical protein [unclassified Candidatus Tisiphia]|uniref:hypothetical protein n=1 Tax=unclassified Candidatus Tisiphia TaxID=2996318 RepID=UPI00312C6C99
MVTLKILSTEPRHGIGFILLNIEEPVEKGRILIPAKERLEIDWDMANRLVKENKDFKSFIEEVDDFCITGKTKRPGWKHVNYYFNFSILFFLAIISQIINYYIIK